jgi:hypothetical protein
MLYCIQARQPTIAADGTAIVPLSDPASMAYGGTEFMNTFLFPRSAALLLIGIALTGCSKKSATTPVVQSVLTAWQQGDQASAISRFVAADWSQRPLFAPGSPLSLSEAQFNALPAAEQEAKMNELKPQLSAMRDLAKSVVQAGSDAAGKGDSAQARKYLESVKQFGAAIESPEYFKIVELTGRAIKLLADTELSKLKP